MARCILLHADFHRLLQQPTGRSCHVVLHSRTVGIETTTCLTIVLLVADDFFLRSSIVVDSCSNHQSLKPTCLARA